jgi:hypothetical protein
MCLRCGEESGAPAGFKPLLERAGARLAGAAFFALGKIRGDQRGQPDVDAGPCRGQCVGPSRSRIERQGKDAVSTRHCCGLVMGSLIKDGTASSGWLEPSRFAGICPAGQPAQSSPVKPTTVHEPRETGLVALVAPLKEGGEGDVEPVAIPAVRPIRGPDRNRHAGADERREYSAIAGDRQIRPVRTLRSCAQRGRSLAAVRGAASR